MPPPLPQHPQNQHPYPNFESVNTNGTMLQQQINFNEKVSVKRVG